MVEININLHSDLLPYPFASLPSSLQEAEETVKTWGIAIQSKLEEQPELWVSKGWIRKFSETTAEGFRELVLQSKEIDPLTNQSAHSVRYIYYYPGEYIQPHHHNVNETFTIRKGGCHLWNSFDGITWDYSYCTDYLRITENAIHCLMAGKDGLVMDVEDDIYRSTDWYVKDSSHSKANDWRSLTREDYQVTIEELHAKTIEELSKRGK